MKKLTTLLLALILLLCACNTDPNNDSPLQYTIYSSNSAGNTPEDGVRESEAAENVSFGDISDIDIYFSDITPVENKNAQKQKPFKLGGESELTLELQNSFSTPLNGCGIEKFKKCGLFDSYLYESQGEKIMAEFRQGTGELLFYINLKANIGIVEGDLTKDGAADLGNDLMASLYGESVASSYTYDNTYVIDSADTKGYGVRYVKYVHGYPTDDTIYIKYNMQGEVISINAMRIGLFDTAENDVSKEDIEKAKDVLLGTVSESRTVTGNTLTLDSSGRYILEVRTGRADENNDVETELFYININ